MTGSLAAFFCGDGDLDFLPLPFPATSVVVMMVNDVCDPPEFDLDRSYTGLADSLPDDSTPFPVSQIPAPFVRSDLWTNVIKLFCSVIYEFS